MIDFSRKAGRPVQCVQVEVDNDAVFTSQAFLDFYTNANIAVQYTSPGMPQCLSLIHI